MKRKMLISRAGLARSLKCSRSTISGLVDKGMPLRADGQLDRTAALRWIAGSTSGAGGGWDGDHGRASVRERALALLAVPQVKPSEIQSPGTAAAGDEGALLASYTRGVQREVLDLLRGKAGKLPELLHKLGAPPIAVLLAAEIWDAVFFAALSPKIVELYGPLGPAPIVEGADQELAAQFGIPFDPEMTKMIEDCLDEANKFLWPRGTESAV